MRKVEAYINGKRPANIPATLIPVVYIVIKKRFTIRRSLSNTRSRDLLRAFAHPPVTFRQDAARLRGAHRCTQNFEVR